MAESEIERAALIENQRRIVERLNAIEHHLRPKTDAELLAEMKQVSTPKQWQRVIDARVEAATLGEIFEAVAEANGQTVEDFVNPTAKAMRDAQALQSADVKRAEEMQRQERKQKLLAEANSI